jgi:hypothetical protein
MAAPTVYNTEMDSHEELQVGALFGWTAGPALGVVEKYLASVKKFPNPPAPNLTQFPRRGLLVSRASVHTTTRTELGDNVLVLYPGTNRLTTVWTPCTIAGRLDLDEHRFEPTEIFQRIVGRLPGPARRIVDLLKQQVVCGGDPRG